MNTKSVKSRKLNKRPFIVPFIYYTMGVTLMILAIYLINRFFININNDGITGVFTFLLLVAIISGLGILSFIVGYKRRKW